MSGVPPPMRTRTGISPCHVSGIGGVGVGWIAMGVIVT
jgi:hypothetical protein